MANQEPFTFGNGNRAPEQTPHSGVHHGERPVREFDTPLPDAVEQGLIQTPDSPASLVSNPAEKKGRWKKPVAVGTLVLAAAAGTFGIGRATSGGNSASPEAEPTASAPATPGETVNTPTPEQLERQDLHYNLSPDYFIDKGFYDQAKSADTSGIGGYDISSYLDTAELENTIQDLLDNETYVRETGDKDGLLATFKQLPSGEFAGSGTAESLEDQHAYAASLQEKYPNMPLTSKKLVSIDQVIPDLEDPNSVSVEFTYLDMTVGDYVADGTGGYFKSSTTKDKVKWDLDLATVEGWSDEGSRVTWVIEETYLLDSETVS